MIHTCVAYDLDLKQYALHKHGNDGFINEIVFFEHPTLPVLFKYKTSTIVPAESRRVSVS